MTKEAALLLAIIVGCFALMWCCAVSTEKEYLNGYKAWVKLTGNTNSLSYTEWKALVKSTKDTQIYYYQH